VFRGGTKLSRLIVSCCMSPSIVCVPTVIPFSACCTYIHTAVHSQASHAYMQEMEAAESDEDDEDMHDDDEDDDDDEEGLDDEDDMDGADLPTVQVRHDYQVYL
jgi:hypothetical protein